MLGEHKLTFIDCNAFIPLDVCFPIVRHACQDGSCHRNGYPLRIAAATRTETDRERCADFRSESPVAEMQVVGMAFAVPARKDFGVTPYAYFHIFTHGTIEP